MHTFDSSIKRADTEIRDAERSTSGNGIGSDMSKLSATENRNIASVSGIGTALHHLEIAGAMIGGTAVTGTALGSGFGLADERMWQVHKYPLASSIFGGSEIFGGSAMARDLMRTESSYMSGAAKFGARGLVVGAVAGAVLFAGYEIKNHHEK